MGDIFVTATGQIDIIGKEHMMLMKDGAILANSGHFNIEISLKDLEGISKKKRNIRDSVEEHILKNDKKLYLLGEGRLINLVAAEGHPPEVMMCSFANQLLSVRYLMDMGETHQNSVIDVPREIDQKVAWPNSPS